LFIAIAGKTLESLEETGEARAMATVMLGDRIRDRAKEKEMVIMGGTTRSDMDMRNRKAVEHLKRAYDLGKNFSRERS
jgi:NAD(P)H dehydrogenase (quinone)